MKTLEEKAKEAFVILGDKYFNLLKGTNPRGDFKHFIKMAVEYGFRHGCNAALEWISVEDELPKKGKWILVRINESYHTMCIKGDSDMKFFLANVIVWRPINND